MESLHTIRFSAHVCNGQFGEIVGSCRKLNAAESWPYVGNCHSPRAPTIAMIAALDNGDGDAGSRDFENETGEELGVEGEREGGGEEGR